jgi:serine/threonine-protein kinase
LATRLRRGSKLGKYRLDRLLGRGSFAEVWKARDCVESHTVALKVALPEVVAASSRDSIEQEARIASCLRHPNIVRVYNADWVGDRFIIATELATTSLETSTRVRRSGRLALETIRQTARGLAHAHEMRVLHRDVKPDNILLFPDGRAALCDFGASRFSLGKTREYTEAGTLGYIAPEQAYGRVRFASDVFSLGLIAYEVLSGVLPTWPFEWPPEGYRSFCAKVPEPLRPVLRKAAEFEPTQRYADAGEFSAALERAFAKLEEEPRPRPTRRRRRKLPAPSPLSVQAEAFRKVHGKALGLRFRCHRCNGPIAEEMSYCPWCGSQGNSFSELTRFPLVCPECERGVRPEWNSCPWCYAGRFESNGRPPPHDPIATRKCGMRGCGGQLRPFMRYCPLCKRKTRRAWSHPDLPHRCPRCRWPTSHEFMRFCPWCGRREPRAGSFTRYRE